MKKISILFFAISILLFNASCKKKVEVRPPVIEILSPAENNLFTLPKIIIVKLHIISEQALSVVRISIDNQDQIPISVPVFLYPEADEFDFEVEINLDQIPEETIETYLYVKAESSGGVAKEFLQLQFEGPYLISKGFYLITSPTLNQTNIQYFDTAFSNVNFIDLPKEFNDAAVSSKEDMLFVSTKTPGKLQAYHHQDSELAWEKEAQMPFPELYSLNLSEPIIYTGTENGRILGFRTNNGIEQFISELVFDSVPGEIGVFTDYIIADYKSLTGPERGWLVFYKETAALFQKHSSQINVHAFYPAISKNHAVVFGNIGSLGVIQFYDIDNNDILISLNFATGIITASCQMESGFFLIAVGKDIWQFKEQQQNITLIQQTEEEIVDLQYDPVEKRIYIATEHQLLVYNATGDTLLNGIDSENPIRKILLRLGYPSFQDE